MWKFLKQLWGISVERAKARKAVRILVKQVWSVEFLIYILTKSVELSHKNMYVVLKNKDGQELIIRAGTPEDNKLRGKEEELDVREANVTWERVRDAAEVQGLL